MVIPHNVICLLCSQSNNCRDRGVGEPLQLHCQESECQYMRETSARVLNGLRADEIITSQGAKNPRVTKIILDVRIRRCLAHATTCHAVPRT